MNAPCMDGPYFCRSSPYALSSLAVTEGLNPRCWAMASMNEFPAPPLMGGRLPVPGGRVSRGALGSGGVEGGSTGSMDFGLIWLASAAALLALILSSAVKNWPDMNL